MPTISPYQKRFIAKGKAEGKQEDVLNTLSIRFHTVPEDLTEAVQNIASLARLDQLLRSAILADSLDTFRSEL